MTESLRSFLVEHVLRGTRRTEKTVSPLVFRNTTHGLRHPQEVVGQKGFGQTLARHREANQDCTGERKAGVRGVVVGNDAARNNVVCTRDETENSRLTPDTDPELCR